MHIRTRSVLLVFGALLASPLPASAIGDVTCETPETAGVVAVVPLTADPRDDVALTKVEQENPIGVIKIAGPLGGEEQTDECVVGPLPPMNVVNASPGATTEAYVEHGLSEFASWTGFRFELALPQGGLPEGGTLTLLAIDFDTAGALGAQYRVAVQRAAGSEQLVLSRVDGTPAEIGRTAVGAGAVSLSWAGGALALRHAGGAIGDALPAGSRARAVRMGYLGVDAPQGQPTEVYVHDPAFVAE